MMTDFSQYMVQAKKDVNNCLNIWKEIFEENYENRIELVYTKGSAINTWDSLIDYVPILSDVDIHIKPYEGVILFENQDEAFYSSIATSATYEDLFLERYQDHIHVPRTQLVNLDRVIKKEEFLFPNPDNVRVLKGSFSFTNKKSDDFIRRIDRHNIFEQEDFLNSLPNTIIDRSGIDLWNVIRRMCWRVSPTPIRLLSQILDDPLALWNLNRTKIVQELQEEGYEHIAENYQDYYYEGWLAFLDGFNDSDNMRRIISLGYEIIRDCLEEVKKIEP